MNGNDPNASDALVRAMLDSSLDAVVGMDAHGNVLEFSRTAELMFGYAREEAIGKLAFPPEPDPRSGLRFRRWILEERPKDAKPKRRKAKKKAKRKKKR